MWMHGCSARGHLLVGTGSSPARRRGSWFHLAFAAVALQTAATAAPLGLDLQRLLYSNLGGKGPSQAVMRGIRFGGVAEVSGVKVDMIVDAEGDYSPVDARQNGVKQIGGHPSLFGSINVPVGTKVDLVVNFVDSSTNIPVKVPAFYFTLYDMDNGEQLEIAGFSQVYLSTTSKLEYQSTAASTFFRVEDADAPDPEAPLVLSHDQLAHAATFVFKELTGDPVGTPFLGITWCGKFLLRHPLRTCLGFSLARCVLVSPSGSTMRCIVVIGASCPIGI